MLAAVTAAIDHPVGVAEFLAGVAKLVVRDRVDTTHSSKISETGSAQAVRCNGCHRANFGMSQLERKIMVNAVSRRD
jgi:hypothetical protein